MRSSITGNDDTHRLGCSARSNTSAATPKPTPAIKQAERAKPRAHKSSHQTRGDSVRPRHQFSLGGRQGCPHVRMRCMLPRAAHALTADATPMDGTLCVRGVRFPVASPLAMIADGMTVDEVLVEHPRARGGGECQGPPLRSAGHSGRRTSIAAARVRFLVPTDQSPRLVALLEASGRANCSSG